MTKASELSDLVLFLISYFISFFFLAIHALPQVGSWFPDQGWNPCLLRWKCSLNHWTTREIAQRFVLMELQGHYEERKSPFRKYLNFALI